MAHLLLILDAVVRQHVDDQDSPALPQDAMHFRQRPPRLRQVVQYERHDGRIQLAVIDGQRFHVAASHLDVMQALQALAGRYSSEEADGMVDLSVKEGRLMLTPYNRPSMAAALTPLARDVYQDEEGLVEIVRSASASVDGIRFIHPRVYNMVFARTGK